ncbi:MAG TPA: MFS transporter, partial [Myxococcaceae bacterium]|nr:MFS transporter [Myxococcaceae bacterium]
GWRSAVLWSAILIGTGSLAGFLWIESRQAHPMLPLRLFRSRQFVGANATTLAVYFGLSGAFFLLMLQLQQVLGYSPFIAGASFAPVTVLLLVLSPVASRLAVRRGYRAPMTVGPLIAGVGMLWMSAIGPGARYFADVFPGVLLLGLGLSLTVAPLTPAVLESVDSQYAGVASGVNNAVARIAGLLGVALVPLAGGALPIDLTNASAFTEGFRRGMWSAGLACFLGALSSLLTLGRENHGARVTESNRRPHSLR